MKELVDLYPDMFLLWFDGYQLKKHNSALIQQDRMYKEVSEKKLEVLLTINSETTKWGELVSTTDVILVENAAGRGEKSGVPWPRDDPYNRPAK